MYFSELDMTIKDKDLCSTCAHMWKDFPMPLEKVIPHCEVADRIEGFKSLDELVAYPCLTCPYNSYKEKK